MGRVRNAQIEEEDELEDELSSLHEQLSNKKSEFINLRIRRHLDSIKLEMEFLTRRFEILEESLKQQNIEPYATNSRIFSLLVVITAISTFYYKLRH